MKKEFNCPCVIDTLNTLLEERCMYLISTFNSADISAITGIPVFSLDSCCREHFGCSTDYLIMKYRISHAAYLLKNGVPFSALHRLAGFRSEGSLKRALSSIAD